MKAQSFAAIVSGRIRSSTVTSYSYRLQSYLELKGCLRWQYFVLGMFKLLISPILGQTCSFLFYFNTNFAFSIKFVGTSMLSALLNVNPISMQHIIRQSRVAVVHLIFDRFHILTNLHIFFRFFRQLKRSWNSCETSSR